MRLEESCSVDVICDSDPCEEKTHFRIRAPNFRDLENANDAAGTISPLGYSVAKRQKERADAIERGEDPPELFFNEEERQALNILSRWVRDRNTALVVQCLTGADNKNFSTPHEVEQFLLKLRPLDSVRDVIDELANKIENLDNSSKKKNS